MDILISLLVFCIVGGLLVWLVRMLPIPDPFKNIAICVVVLILILVLLEQFVGLGYMHGSFFPRRE